MGTHMAIGLEMIKQTPSIVSPGYTDRDTDTE